MPPCIHIHKDKKTRRQSWFLYWYWTRARDWDEPKYYLMHVHEWIEPKCSSCTRSMFSFPNEEKHKNRHTHTHLCNHLANVCWSHHENRIFASR